MKVTNIQDEASESYRLKRYQHGPIWVEEWRGQCDDAAYFPVMESERPGSGTLQEFIDELILAVEPREVVFVNVVNVGLYARLEDQFPAIRILCPEDAFEDNGFEAKRKARARVIQP